MYSKNNISNETVRELKKRLVWLSGLSIVAIVFVFISISKNEHEGNREILQFNSKEEILQTLKDYQEKSYPIAQPAAELQETPERSPNAASKRINNSTDHSLTNVQVQGVDEADVVKTDGEHIYHLHERELVIAKAHPVDSFEVVSRTQFGKDFYPREMFVDRTTITVLGYTDNPLKINRELPATNRFVPAHNSAYSVLIYEISNMKNLKLLRRIDFQGEYVSSRKIDDMLYLATNTFVYVNRDPELPLEDRNYLPMYRDSAKSGEFVPVDFHTIYHFSDQSSNQYLNVATIQLSDAKSPVRTSSYLGGGSQLYMSDKNMYIAKADLPKRMMTFDSWKPTTTVYKFAVSKNGLNFKSKGEVPGTLLNQFSMDEYKGYFRVATTKNMFQTQSENSLYVFDGNMNIVGKIEGLAEGERIYSVRFMGDQGYVVTFKHVDPLFAIDLKDPKAPQVAGELKIPGFSTYLHPYDEKHVIGFGRDTEEKKLPDGRTVAVRKGIKLSMFDVSDMKHPKEMFTTVIGDASTYSQLENNHKALLFSQDKNLFAFPIVQSNANAQPFMGFYVYGIDLQKGFVLKATVSFNENAAHGFGPQRMLYIGDTLYSISDTVYKFHDINTLQEVRPPYKLK